MEERERETTKLGLISVNNNKEHYLLAGCTLYKMGSTTTKNESADNINRQICSNGITYQFICLLCALCSAYCIWLLCKLNKVICKSQKFVITFQFQFQLGRQ